jgi:hypothetical protein
LNSKSFEYELEDFAIDDGVKAVYLSVLCRGHHRLKQLAELVFGPQNGQNPLPKIFLDKTSDGDRGIEL